MPIQIEKTFGEELTSILCLGSFRAASITQSTLVDMPFFFFSFLFLCSHNHLALMQQGGLVETLSRVFFCVCETLSYLRECDNPAFHLMSVVKFTFFFESVAGRGLVETNRD